VGAIDLKVNSASENSNKFQKTRFWKENSVENVVTLWANGTGHASTSNKEKPRTKSRNDAKQEKPRTPKKRWVELGTPSVYFHK
jgi:hypothetical protein